MPAISGKAVGSQNVAKAGVNLETKEDSLAIGAAFITNQLITAGMPKLSFQVTCDQVHSVQVVCQVAYRRTAAGIDNYEFLTVLPVQLASANAPLFIEINAPAQAMRMQITNPGAAPGVATNITAVLMASG